MNHKGFSSIEWLIIIVVIAILMALVFSHNDSAKIRCRNMYNVARTSHDSLIVAVSDESCALFLRDSLK